MQKDMSRRHPRKPAKNANGKNNTKPIIWTVEFVQKEAREMLATVRKDKTVTFIGTLFDDKEYTRENFNFYRARFKKDDQISFTIRKIEEILESRCAQGGLIGKFNANAYKFHMINNHDWRDKSEVENKHKGLPTLAAVFAAAQRRKKGEQDESEEEGE